MRLDQEEEEEEEDVSMDDTREGAVEDLVAVEEEEALQINRTRGRQTNKPKKTQTPENQTETKAKATENRHGQTKQASR